ncbi:hypothetical protein ACEQ8H_005647 [Pleosporales sp. CAS-2024a]
MPRSSSSSRSPSSSRAPNIALLDFPLSMRPLVRGRRRGAPTDHSSPQTLDQTIMELQRMTTRLSRGLEGLGVQRTTSAPTNGPRATHVVFGDNGNPGMSAFEPGDGSERAVVAEARPKQPILTTASVLPPTTYNEQKESGKVANTHAYVKVQCALLKFAQTNSIDSLSPQQAVAWTQAIDPTGYQRPEAAEALRLCYYMRAQGFDVYAQVKDEWVSLYLCHQGYYSPDPKRDVLYWKQSFKTQVVEYEYQAIPDFASTVEGQAYNALRQVSRNPVHPSMLGTRDRTRDPGGRASLAQDRRPIVEAYADQGQEQARSYAWALAQARVQMELNRSDHDAAALGAALEVLDGLQPSGST